MKVAHSTLAPLLRNSTQGDVLAQTLLHPGREFSLSDLRRLTGHGLSMVHKEVNLLVDGGVLLNRQAGRTRQVSANLDYPLIGPLTTIVEATYGPLPVISEELTGLAGIEGAYCQREGVIAVGQRGGKVVGGSDAPLACGGGQDGDVLRVDVPVAGEPGEAELSEDVPGSEGVGGAGGAECGDQAGR